MSGEISRFGPTRVFIPPALPPPFTPPQIRTIRPSERNEVSSLDKALLSRGFSPTLAETLAEAIRQTSGESDEFVPRAT